MTSSLNGGTKLHPLSDHALLVLRGFVRAPIVASAVNPGIRDRLTRGGLAIMERLPSPYRTAKGKLVDWLSITKEGGAELARLDTPRKKS